MPAVQPRYANVIGEARTRKDTPTGHKGPPFLYTWRPGAWDVEEGRIVPTLSVQAAMDGINGCSAQYDNRGEVVGLRTGRLRDVAERVGGVVIAQTVDAPEHPNYCMVTDSGSYCDRWTTTYPGTERVTFDHAGFASWRVSLVKRGIIPEPSVGDLEALKTKVDNRRRAIAMALSRVPAELRTEDDERRRTQAAEDIQMLDAEIKRRTAKTKPARTRAAEVMHD